MGEWISAHDSNPESDEIVLCSTDDGLLIVGFFDGDEWCSGNYWVSWDYASNHGVNVTHWQPLPEPPKDGE